MLKSDLCNYSDACIIVKETIYLLADDVNENDKTEKNILHLKIMLHLNHAFNNTLIDIDRQCRRS